MEDLKYANLAGLISGLFWIVLSDLMMPWPAVLLRVAGVYIVVFGIVWGGCRLLSRLS